MLVPYNKSSTSTYTIKWNQVRTAKSASGSPSTTSTSGNSYSLSNTDSRSGFKNPQHLSQMRRGLDATTPYTASIRTIEVPRIPTRVFTRVGCLTYFNQSVYDIQDFYTCGPAPVYAWNGTGMPIPTMTSDQYNVTLGKFYQKAQGVVTKFQGGVFLGELGETLRMIRRPGSALRDHWLDYGKLVSRRLKKVPHKLRVAHANGRSVKRIHNTLAGTYLEAVFGALPLIGDVEDAIDLLNDLPDDKKREVHRFRHFTHVQTLDDSTLQQNQPIGGSTGLRYWDLKFERKSGVRLTMHGAIGIQVDFDHKTIGLGLTSALPTLYELVPYSFLVDYFSNLGDIVNAASLARQRYIYRVMSEKRYCKQVISYSLDMPLLLQNLSAQYVGGSYDPATRYQDVLYVPADPTIVNRITFSRQSFTDYVPQLVFRHPAVGSMKWLNITALGLVKVKI